MAKNQTVSEAIHSSYGRGEMSHDSGLKRLHNSDSSMAPKREKTEDQRKLAAKKAAVDSFSDM